MHITSITIQGLDALPACKLQDLSSHNRFSGPSPASSAVGEALAFAFASLAPENFSRLLRQWAWGKKKDIELFAEPLLEQAMWKSRNLAEIWMHPAAERSLQIDMVLALDSARVGRILEGSRDPQVVRALMSDPLLKLSFSVLFSRSFDALRFAKPEIFLGEDAFKVAADVEKTPFWITSLLASFSSCFYRLSPQVAWDDLPRRALNDLLSVSGFRRYQAWQESLQKYGEVRVVYEDDIAHILADDRPLGRHGFQAQYDASVAGAIHLSGAEIVWIDGPVSLAIPEKVQVFSADTNGDVEIEVTNPFAKPVLRFAQKP